MNKCNPIPCSCKDGPQGVQGLRGAKGSDGAPGIDGIQGPIGLQGEQGLRGEKGVVGDQGVTGANVVGGTGPVGAQGPDGNQGPQGIDGLDGASGADGTDGANFEEPLKIVYTGVCNPGDLGTVCTQCTACESWVLGGSLNGQWVFNKNTGAGFSRIDVGSSVPIGRRFTIVGTLGAAGYFFRIQSGTTFEMSAYNSFTANIATNGALLPPYKGVHFQASQGQGSNVIEVLHIGSNRWVIIKATLNNGQLPLFIY